MTRHKRTRTYIPDLDEAVGRLLRLWRWNAAMTLDQVAAAMGSHRPIVGRLESGLHSPSIPSIVRFAKATGADVRQVFDLVDAFLAPGGVGSTNETVSLSRRKHRCCDAPALPGGIGGFATSPALHRDVCTQDGLVAHRACARATYHSSAHPATLSGGLQCPSS